MSIISENAQNRGPDEHCAPLEQQKVFPVSPTTARITLTKTLTARKTCLGRKQFSVME